MRASGQGCCARLAIGLLGLVHATSQASEPRLADLSLEALSNIEITSVSKRTERLSDAPTSIFVITAADIRRAGVASLAEALRLASNLQVVRASSWEYTASARGFNSSSANKLLVLIDGRSVYTPLFSGVFWDVQDVMLEDVERIEVISGPGGTLWGVNAVNGVINVITRSAQETVGGLVSAHAGDRERRLSARFGAAIDNGLAWRLFATRTDTRDSETADGTRIDDAGHLTHVGARADGERGADRFTLQAEAYKGRREQPLPGTIVITGMPFELGPISVSGAHVLGRWERRLPDGASMLLQAYAERTRRTVVPSFGDAQDIADVQFQHTLAPIGPHRAVWGLQYRLGDDRTDNSPYVAFLPAHLRQRWASLFLQDQVTLNEDWQLTLGARAERNDYTGTEFLPTLRLAWKWHPRHLLWAGATRTVRAPSRLDHDTYVPGSPPFLLRGGPSVKSETADVLELGYRGQPTASSSLSATAHTARYKRLRTQEIDPSFTYIYYANGMAGDVSGLELWGTLQLNRSWRVHAGYNRLWQDLRLREGKPDLFAEVPTTEGQNPAYWWTLRSSWDPRDDIGIDLNLRQVARLRMPDVPRYTALDLRMAWRPVAALELALYGQNLTGGGHGEFTEVATRQQLKRAWFAQVQWHF